MKALILHLSDLHLNETHNSSIDKFKSVGIALQNEEIVLDRAIVVVSGDIAYSGNSKEYAIARESFESLEFDLKTRLKLDDIQFVYTPGNHDCNFENPNNSVREIVIESIRQGKTPDKSMLDCCSDIQSDFFNFRDELQNTKPHHDHSALHWEYRIEKDGFSIQFRCYNTAWMSHIKEEQGGLQIPEDILDSNEWTDKNDYVVTAFHHPYNWMPSDTYRRFKGKIEESSDLILTGHEHEPEHYQKYSFSGEINEYLEGSVFQEHNNPNRSGFHAVYIDLYSQKQRTLTYAWNKDKYIPENSNSSWVGYKRGTRRSKRDFQIGENHSIWLNDPGANYQHPSKDNISLTDIYVFPNLKKFTIKNNSEFVYSSLVEGEEFLKILSSKNKVFILGRQQAGKTTLAKVLFLEYYRKELTPVIIDGSDIKSSHLNLDKLEKLIEKKFELQYASPDLCNFHQLDRDKTVLLFDDFDHSALNYKGRATLIDRLNSRYDNIIILGDDLLKVEEFVSEGETKDLLSEYEQYEIVQFGHLLRHKLISQWYSIGNEYDGNQHALAHNIHKTEQVINTMLGRSYLPSYPVFILTLIQSQESNLHSSAGTYGSLYEILITQALATGTSSDKLDLKLTYLSELAFWMYEKKHKRISNEEWEVFHRSYCSKYKVYPIREDLRKNFFNQGLFSLRDECYGFRYSASYYYFIARYLRDNLSKPETKSKVRELIRHLLSTLNKVENVSIWLFLTHLSKDTFLINEILTHSSKIFNKLSPASFKDDVGFLDKFSESVEKIVLDNKKFSDLKEDRLRHLDDVNPLPEAVTSHEDQFDEQDAKDVLDMVSELKLALRTLEVLGQLVKNFPGSLIGTEKYELVKESYNLGLRTISMLLDVYEKDIEGFAELVFGRIVENHPDIKDLNDLKKRIKLFTYWMIESSCFNMVNRISQAVGHSQLGETYREIISESNSNAYKLIDISIRLDNLGFPENDLIDLNHEFKDHPFCNRILRQLAVQHFYMFPTLEETKQKVCQALDIELSTIHQVQFYNKETKQIASSPKRKKRKSK